jgi:SAM-dependent methyltransferase
MAFWKLLIRKVIPPRLRVELLRRTRRPPVGGVRWGQLRRLGPVSRVWGGDRGQALDRFYIEAFLERHRGDVRGRVLEVGDDAYTRRFGGGAVEAVEVLHAEEGNARADHVVDLTAPPRLPEASYHCILCTQTLQFLPDLGAAVANLHRLLVPGGVLLVTVPGISQVDPVDEGGWVDHWRFTGHGLRWLLERTFPAEALEVESWGNVLVATAFLQGLATEELLVEELDYRDPAYPVLLTARAVKPGEAP